MQEQQKQLVERLKQAQNILVAVSASPSVDQLSAAIGLTLALNHLGKHGTAVYSGETPSTIEFLRPEDTLEKNTDSLRDFIIALDKSKADKLRYKVEDDVVRIFITPYKTSISDKDLDFSQGDFNVDVVLALGVREQSDLDSAITAHGRILHDATVASINTQTDGQLGTINWTDASASSLSEMVATLVSALDKKVLDSQIATALLTGVVATTERFSNDKTTPKTMSASAELMAAGANPQLIATQLATPSVQSSDSEGEDAEGTDKPKDAGSGIEEQKSDPGTLEITHKQADDEASEPESNPSSTLPIEPEQNEPDSPQVHVDENGQLVTVDDEKLPEIGPARAVGEDASATSEPESVSANEPVERTRMTEEPQIGGSLTANSEPEALDPSTDTLTLPQLETPVLSHDDSPFDQVPTPAINTIVGPTAHPAVPPQFQPPASASQTPPTSSDALFGSAPANVSPPLSPITPDEKLTEIEAAVGSPYAAPAEATHPSVDDARDAVAEALKGGSSSDADPIEALNAQPIIDTLHPSAPPASPVAQFQPSAPTQNPGNTGFSEPTPGNSPADATLDMPLPGMAFGSSQPPANLFGVPSQTGSSPFPTSQPAPGPAFDAPPAAPQNSNPNAPPPVPPPMLPPLQ